MPTQGRNKHTELDVTWSPMAALLLLSVSGFPDKKFPSSLVIRVASRRVSNEINLNM